MIEYLRRALMLLAGALACIGLAALQPAMAATVNAASTSPMLIGNVVAGKTYQVIATGVANLCTGCNGGNGLTFTANGKPTGPFAAPYGSFYPNGLDYDPSGGPSAYGVGGPQRLYGVLLGTFTATPHGYGDYFAMGDSYVFTATTSGALYGKINDCCDGDNAGGYSVTLKEVTVVSATSVPPTFIGNVVAGKTYRVTATGVASLCTGCNGGNGLTFTANGKPTGPFAAPYNGFYPNGLDYDPSTGPSAYGVGGPQRLYGVLLGTFTATPQGYGDYFAMGDSYLFTATVSGPLYGKINDCCDGDNAGSYYVRLSETAETILYSYDALGRLVGVTHSGGINDGVASGYTYDAAGNRTRVTVSGAP